MKMYHWINSYTTGGQNTAIQLAHAQVGLINDYLDEDVKKWMKDKTTVVLKGGNHSDLVKLHQTLKETNVSHYAFYESEEALNGACTNVCCLPSERVTIAANFVRQYGLKSCISFDDKLYIRIDQEGNYDPLVKPEIDNIKRNNNEELVISRYLFDEFTKSDTILIKLIASGRLA